MPRLPYRIYLQLLVAALVAASPAAGQPYAYVASSHAHNVLIIDTATNTVVGSVDVGAGNKPESIVAAPNGSAVYVASNPELADDGMVSVIDTASNTVAATIATAGGPHGIAVTPNGQYLYVTNFYGNNPPSNRVWVINTATNTIVQTIAVGSFPHGIALNASGTRAYVANAFSNDVSVIDTVANAVVATIPVGAVPHGVAVSPDGALVYVTNYDSGTVSAINATTNTVTATIPLATAFVEGVVFSADGALAYVCHQHSNFLSIIDTAASLVVGTVTVGTNPFGLELTPNGKHLYVANQNSQSVSVVSTVTNAAVATISAPAGSFPLDVAFVGGSQGLMFSGFHSPVGGADGTGGSVADPLRAFKLRSTIPIKMTLSDGGGLPVTTGVHTIQVAKFSDATTSEVPVDASPTDGATNGNRFRLSDASTGEWHFNLDTRPTGMTKGIWQIKATLSDGSVHTAFAEIK